MDKTNRLMDTDNDLVVSRRKVGGGEVAGGKEGQIYGGLIKLRFIKRASSV